MKSLKKVLVMSLGVLGLLVTIAWFFYFRTARENRLMAKGDEMVKVIEDFYREKGRLPYSLEEIKIQEGEGSDAVFYNKRDSIHYTLSFGMSLSESKIYYSDSKRWEDKYREME